MKAKSQTIWKKTNNNKPNETSLLLEKALVFEKANLKLDRNLITARIYLIQRPVTME